MARFRQNTCFLTLVVPGDVLDASKPVLVLVNCVVLLNDILHGWLILQAPLQRLITACEACNIPATLLAAPTYTCQIGYSLPDVLVEDENNCFTSSLFQISSFK